MSHRLVVLSDLHTGPGGPYDIDVRLKDLTNYLSALQPEDLLVLNGDSFDFLMVKGALDLRQAEAKAREMFAEGTPARRLLSSLRQHLQRGGQVTVRAGNHDLELAVPSVQAHMREICPGLGFEIGPRSVFSVGEVRVVVGHGELEDHWNRFSHAAVRRQEEDFDYPPGSDLVVQWLNRAKAEGMAFVDLLKPDMEGAVLAALAIDPGLLRLVPGGRSFLWQRLRRTRERGIHELVQVDGGGPSLLDRLDDESLAALEQLVSQDQDPTEAFAEGLWTGISTRVRAAWLRAALYVCARLQHHLAADDTEAFFTLRPQLWEWELAQQEALATSAEVAIFGHTHAARLGTRKGLVLVNTGTWIPLLRLPPADADIGAYQQLLEDLTADPGLTRTELWGPERMIRPHTAAVVEATEAGARVSLVRFEGGEPEVLGTREACPSEPLSALEMQEMPGATAPTALHTRQEGLARELAWWDARSKRVHWGVLTESRCRDVVVAQSRALLDQSRAAGDAMEATELLSSAEAVFQLYRDLDGQRRLPVLGGRLQVADAIAIDGYTAVLKALGQEVVKRRLPTPLVYLQPGYSPATFPRGRTLVGPGLRHRGSAPTIELSLPVVLLPPDHLEAPWLLTIVLHEVGHDLDHDLGLLEGLDLSGLAAQRRDAWKRWAGEILADLIAMYLAGPWFAVSLVGLAAAFGWHWSLQGVHPPLALRRLLLVDLLQRMQAPEVAAHLPDAPQMHQLQGYRDEVPDVLEALLGLPVRGSTLGQVLKAVGSQSWRGLPGLVQEVASTRGERAALGEFERLATTLEPFVWQVSPDYRRFIEEHVPTLVPTFREPETLFKAPPLPLLVRFDRCSFVGHTHGQLLPRFQQALVERGRGWERLELFFLKDPSRITRPGTSAQDLEEEQADALAALRPFLQEHAAEWGIWRFDDPFLFASFWEREGERRVHASSMVWGQDIRHCPATDCRSVEGAESRDLEVLFAGLEALRQSSDLIASSDLP